MAQKVTYQLVDDVDGGIAEETVTFGLDGVSYEIDLSSAHASELRGALATWVGVARKNKGASVAKRVAGGKAKASEGLDLGSVRDWARAAGHKVSDRGRISSSLLDQYRATH